MPSWVYIITNAAGPGLLKVGFTDRTPELRAQELGTTGLPAPYEVAYAIEVTDGRSVEKAVHIRLAPYHVGKEWFRCPVATAKEVLDELSHVAYSNSPLVPGHALEAFMQPEEWVAPEASPSVLEEDYSPLPPGHPLRGML